MRRPLVPIVIVLALTFAVTLASWTYLRAPAAAGTIDAPQPPLDPQDLEKSLLTRLNSDQLKIIESTPQGPNRSFLIRMFGYRDRLTGSPDETAFAYETLTTYVSGSRTADTEIESNAFVSLGFLARAEAQVGLPKTQRDSVLSMAVRLATSDKEEFRLMSASFISAAKARGQVPSSALAALDSLQDDEYVAAELPKQLKVLEDARQVILRNSSR
jgi:hypothetical protein